MQYADGTLFGGEPCRELASYDVVGGGGYDPVPRLTPFLTIGALSINVSKECYDAIEPGSEWPPDNSACLVS
jgi:hypothetical protein